MLTSIKEKTVSLSWNPKTDGRGHVVHGDLHGLDHNGTGDQA